MRDKKCGVCKKKIIKTLDLGLHPCADTFVKSQNTSLKLKKYPLQVGFCFCNHLTAINKISPKERYTKFDYSYTSDNSPVSKNHFYQIAKIIIRKFKLKRTNSIIEIGSNDGTFLKYVKQLSNVKVLGVDPSKFMCNLANKKNIKTYNNFFNLKNSKIIKNRYEKFDLLYAANVFNHIDNPNNFLKGCSVVLKDNGIIVLEVPDLDSLFRSCGFDTIYHEHRQYFSINSLKKILIKNNYKLLSYEKIDYMSGSLRIFAQKINFFMKLKSDSLVQKKRRIKRFLKFKKKIYKVKKEILEFIDKNKQKGKTIVGIGAATKGNTLLNFCGINYNDLTCIIENSKHKINKYAPGSGIPIKNEKIFRKYDAAIILPWNITKHLYKKFLHKKKISYTSISKIVKKVH